MLIDEERIRIIRSLHTAILYSVYSMKAQTTYAHKLTTNHKIEDYKIIHD